MISGHMVPDLNIPLMVSNESVKGKEAIPEGGCMFNQGMLVHYSPDDELHRTAEELRRKKIHVGTNLKKVALPIIRASCPFQFQSMYPIVSNGVLEKGFRNMMICFKKTLKS